MPDTDGPTITRNLQGPGDVSEVGGLRFVWSLANNVKPDILLGAWPSPQRYVILVVADGYTAPGDFDEAVAKITAGMEADSGRSNDRLFSPPNGAYRDLQIWSLYYPEFATIAAAPGPGTSAFSDTDLTEEHILSSPNLYPRTNALRREIKRQQGIHVDKVLVLANRSERGAGHSGGCMVVAGGYKASYGLFLHEFGHAIGLGDEYSWPNVRIPPPPDGSDYRYPNISKSPWGFRPDTKIPKAEGWPGEGSDDQTTRQGALYTTEAYRPAGNCIMRDAEFGADQESQGQYFCAVCRGRIERFLTLREEGPIMAPNLAGIFERPVL